MKNTQLNHNQHQGRYKKHPICYLLDNIKTPMNVGSLFRVADALGVERLYLSGTTPVPPNHKIKKTSRSTEKYVPFLVVDEPLLLVAELKAAGYTIIALEISSQSVDIRELAISCDESVCLVLGSENAGISPAMLRIADKTAHISMMGENSSMNVATACAIATFEIARNF